MHGAPGGAPILECAIGPLDAIGLQKRVPHRRTEDVSWSAWQAAFGVNLPGAVAAVSIMARGTGDSLP